MIETYKYMIQELDLTEGIYHQGGLELQHEE